MVCVFVCVCVCVCVNAYIHSSQQGLANDAWDFTASTYIATHTHVQ